MLAQRFRIHDDPAVTGDLFFYPVGNTSFDIPDATPSNESSLMNLVTDAERYAELYRMYCTRAGEVR